MRYQWSATWEGHPILVQTRMNLLWSTDELWVDGILVDRQKSSAWFLTENFAIECLAAPVCISDRVHNIEVLMTQGTFRPYRNILIDGELVGGDVDINLKSRRIDFTKLETFRRKGIGRYLVDVITILSLTFGVLAPLITIIDFVIINSFVYPYQISLGLILQSCLFGALGGVLFGLWFGTTTWRVYGVLYADSVSHRQKLSAPPQSLD
jgi:hypothetical protein